MIDIVEVLQHWHAGRPKAVIAESLGVDRKTIGKYVAPAVATGLSPGAPALGRAEWSVLVAGWFPELTDKTARSLTYATIDAHRDRIAEMLTTNTVATVHQRLRDEHGLAVGISSFRRYLWLAFPDAVARERVTVLRPEVPPGEEAQIDYGFLGNWLDPKTNKTRRVWAFVIVLAASRHMFVRPVLIMDQRSWVTSHVAAFGFFGGVTRRLVPDNLKTGVDRPDLYDPKLNRAYGELAHHYGTLIDPARARKPKDKPRVERQMPYVRDSFWRGRTFTSENDMQSAAVTWCSDVAGLRHHRSLDGAAPLSVFQAVEAEALIRLPRTRFELASWAAPKVGPDCHIKVGGALYSVPWRLIGRTVDARAGERVVEVFVDGVIVKTWARIERGRQTDYSDYPPEKVAFFMRTPQWCKKRAYELGPAVTELVAVLLEPNVLHHLRAAQGVLGLADKYGTERLDAACRRATLVGDPAYRTVKGILLAGTEHDGEEPPSGASVPAHLHGRERLFELDAPLGEMNAS